MAGRGPAPKDPSERQRRNTPRALEVVHEAFEVRQALVEADGDVPAPPSPPAGLLKATRDRWERFWSSRVASLVDRTSDMPALERLFELYDDATRYRTSIRKNPMVEGSKGQMVRNPFVRDLQTTQAEIRQLEDRFGLSPRARLSLNLTLGTTAKTMQDLNSDFAAGGDDDDDPRYDFDGEVVDDEAAERAA